MPKEFSGGAPKSTSLFSKFGDYYHSREVHPIVEPDFSGYDTPEDAARELIAAGKPLKPLIESLTAEPIQEAKCSAIGVVLGFISSYRNPRLAANHLKWVSGSLLAQGVSAASLARKHGQSKQAFCQGAFVLAEKLGIRPPQAMRDEAAKVEFSRSNYRRNRR